MTVEILGEAGGASLTYPIGLGEHGEVDLSAPSLLEPEHPRIRLKLTVELGGTADEAVVLRRLRVGVSER